MSNRFFDWIARAAAQRFITRDTLRGSDMNAALDLVTAGFDLMPRGVCFSAQASANTTCNNATLTLITFGTENYDPDSVFAANRFTVPANGAGYYYITAQLDWASRTLGTNCFMWLFKNGAGLIAAPAITTDAVNAVRTQVSAHLLLAAGDYIEIYGSQTNGGAATRNVNLGADTFFSGHQIRANGAQG